MRITDLLSSDTIMIDANVRTKQQAIDTLIDLQCKGGNIEDKKVFKDAILRREQTATTAIGSGIAIPHAKSSAVKAPSLAAITVARGVDYGAADGKDSRLIFMIAAPQDGDMHLEVLSRLMQLLLDKDFVNSLVSAKSKTEFLQIIDNKDNEIEKKTKNPTSTQGTSAPYRIVAVTACPTGIAHTYMAAEALQKAGDSLGVPIKVETNGSGGAKNVLTKEDISGAEAVLITADKSVEMARFDGKRLLSTKVADGIHKPEELIKTALNGDLPVYRYSGNETIATGIQNDSFGRQIYKHLMNGVSHMLPFVVAGGIFIALAFLIDTISGVDPEVAGGNFGVSTPVSAFFKNIGGFAFNFMVPVLSGFIAMSIADRPGLLVGFAGGALAMSGSTFFSPAGGVPSGFLGALLAGFVGGYAMLGLEKFCRKLPRSLEGIKPVLIFPLGGLLAVSVFICAINPVMGAINTSMNKGLQWLSDNNAAIPLGALLGAMMAIDMGGPFNKAAYTFATLGLSAATNASYEIMASVMVGGMVPPIAIALANSIFKSKFSEDERKNAPVNYIMGLSFITEGAIPYAAADPVRVIPSCMLGSAVAGALSMAFRCTLRAPHGGIFVFAVVGNWYWYLLSLAVGSIVSAFVLGLLKNKIK